MDLSTNGTTEKPSRQTLIWNLLKTKINRFNELPLQLQEYVIRTYVAYECLWTSDCSQEDHHHQPLLSNDSSIDSQLMIPILGFVMGIWEHNDRQTTNLEKLCLPDSILPRECLEKLQFIYYRTVPQPGSLWGNLMSYASNTSKQQDYFDIKNKSLTSLTLD